MSVTLTKKEFDKIYTIANKTFVNSVYELYRKNKFGMELCNDIQKIKQLFCYLMSLSSWEQANYTSSYYTNCLNEKQIYSIFSQIKKLN